MSPTDAPESAIGAAVPLESVLCTEELKRRPSRPPDHQVENAALLALAQELTNSPESVLQELVDVALELCRAHSAGISLLEDGPPGALSPHGGHFRWNAVAGRWAPLVWNTTTPRDNGPCGTVLDRNATLLFSNAHRHYTQFAGVHPLLVEGLLVPFHVDGQAVGTVWVVAHDETRKFDAEDRRLLESLATFAAMAYQTRLSIAAQARANHDLEAEILERRRAEEALRESDRRKDEFLAMLGHELRNPLGAMATSVQVLLASPEPASVRWAADVLDRQIVRVTRLVDDLLDISRITHGRIQLRKGALPISDVVASAVERARPLIDSRRHELAISLPDEPVHVEGDAERLNQILLNLLDNAAKYTPEGGRIWVTVEQADGAAVVRVRDTGVGLAPDSLAVIFDFFVQGDRSPDHLAGGLGVGLALARKLAALHGGTLDVSSEGPSKGSEFVLRLPAITDGATRSAPEEALPATASTDSRRVLVVEDNADSARGLGMLLELAGHEVRIARDGASALEAARAFAPEVVLLDIGLPGMDGYEVARRMRELPQTRAATLVALTGYGQDADRLRSQEAGFDRHIVKPIPSEVLLASLDGKRVGPR